MIQIAEDRLDGRVGEGPRNATENLIMREKIIAVHKTDDIAGRSRDPFIQGIIDAFVGLAHEFHSVMSGALNRRKRPVH